MSAMNKAIQFAQEFGTTFAEGKIGRTVMPGPIELFKKEQMKKLQSLVGERGVTEIAQEMGSNYFRGSNVKSIGDSIEYTAENAGVGKLRKGIAGAAFGLAAANALGIEAFGATDQANNLAALGAHATIGSTMYSMGGKAKMAGIGYLAATAINTFRDGDNMGPM